MTVSLLDLNRQYEGIESLVMDAFKDVFSSKQFIMGPKVNELEKALADYTHTAEAIGVSSGTDALLIPLMAKNIGPGDAVITTPFTYVATAEVIALLGAETVFADIYSSTYNINPFAIMDAIKKAKDKGLKPKAIIPVDLFGLPARYRIIREIAQKNNLFLLEDAAQGFGGAIRGVKSGAFGDVAATSFFPAKPLGCYGDGGAIFTDDEDLANIMKSIRVHGSSSDKYENIRIGINGRLDTIQAAILLEKLEIFENEVTLRNKIADYYTLNIPSKLKKPYIPKGYISSYAQYSILANSSQDRIKKMALLQESDIPSMIYYKKPLHLQKAFSNLKYGKGDFPISEEISSKIFSIPMHPYLTKEQQDRIIGVISDE